MPENLLLKLYHNTAILLSPPSLQMVILNGEQGRPTTDFIPLLTLSFKIVKRNFDLSYLVLVRYDLCKVRYFPQSNIIQRSRSKFDLGSHHIKGFISFFSKILKFSVETINKVGKWHDPTYFVSKLPCLQMPSLKVDPCASRYLHRADCKYLLSISITPLT